MALDGNNKNKKWVLQDANGSYLVGEFDGITFIQDSNQEVRIMDVGPDFYAAQTFPKDNLPNNDNRIIQLAWMDHWNGGIGETIWERNATFPVSIGLVSYKDQKVITRNPISEISDIYGLSKSWKSQWIDSKSDLLSVVKSKTFDLSLEIDLTETTASKLEILVANKTITYHISDKTLLSKNLLPDANNRVKIRLLIDWGQLEVFANDGIFSFTQQFAFSPESNDISLTTDGKIKLVSMEFHEIKGIW